MSKGRDRQMKTCSIWLLVVHPLAWVTFILTSLIDNLSCIKIKKTFLTMLAPFSLKIGPFKAKTVVLEFFYFFPNFFGLWSPSHFLVLLCIFFVKASGSRRNIKKRIHAPSPPLDRLAARAAERILKFKTRRENQNWNRCTGSSIWNWGFLNAFKRNI